MIALLCFLLSLFASPFKSKDRLEAENAVLRYQVIVCGGGCEAVTNSDRLFLVQLYCWFPSVLNAITIIRPETVVRWHLPAFASTGAGNHARSEVGRKTAQTCGR